MQSMSVMTVVLQISKTMIYKLGGMRRQWLRQCATNWKIAGSIPDGVVGSFH
jgi:hypothetical protein